MRKKRPRPICACGCGLPYYRRNQIEVWDAMNPGHRTGWHKAVVKINALHHSKATVNRVLTAAQLVAAPEPEKKKA